MNMRQCRTGSRPLSTWPRHLAAAIFLVTLTTAARAYDVPIIAYSSDVDSFTYSGPFDVGTTALSVDVTQSNARVPFCVARLERADFRIDVTLVVSPSSTGTSCASDRPITVGQLPAGRYAVEVLLLDAAGAFVQRAAGAFDVQARARVCSATPTDNLLQLHFSTKSASAFVQRFESDSAYREGLGNITIHEPQPTLGHTIVAADLPPLADPLRVLSALRASGDIDWVSRYNFSLGCSFLCTGDLTALAIEYRHAELDRYFFTHDPVEIAKLDDDATRGGWARTGESWRVITGYGQNLPKEGVTHRIYRFWTPDVAGKPSHFFTVDQRECAQLRDGITKNWIYEGSPFWAHETVDGACPPAAGVPLYRLYNNSIGGAPSHRYATRVAVVDEMIAQGWTNEGVAMCIAPR